MPEKRRKKVIFALVATLLAGLAAAGWRQVKSLEDDAVLLAETGQGAIRVFSELAAGIAAHDLETIAACYDDGYHNPAEALWKQTLESDRDGVKVYRWTTGESEPAGKQEVEDRYAELLAMASRIEMSKVKLDQVESFPGPGRATVRSVVWIRGTRHDGELFETQVRFRMSMHQGPAGWKIQDQQLLRGVTVTGGGRGFGDVAELAGLDFRSRHNPRFEDSDWRLERFGIARYAGSGATAVDFDQDGWYDLFFADGAGARLFRNGGDGTFVDHTVEAGLDPDLPGVNLGLFADFDNDGDKDLFLGRFMDGSRLYRNQGDGRFTDVTPDAGFGKEFVTVGAAADYDGDGDLDLYLGRYLDARTELPTTLVYTRNGEGNSLLRNDGDLRFTDVTAEAGVREGGLTLGVSWADFDADGAPDLYVANDFGRNALFRNLGDGTFADVTLESGTLDPGYGMSVSVGDVENDGDWDIYVSNVHSAQRWYGQAATLYNYFLTSIKQGTVREDFPLYREIWSLTEGNWRNNFYQVTKGNSLFINQGDGRFVDASEIAGVNPFGWYWGSTFLDYDNDGRLDIYAANGWISGETEDDL